MVIQANIQTHTCTHLDTHTHTHTNTHAWTHAYTHPHNLQPKHTGNTSKPSHSVIRGSRMSVSIKRGRESGPESDRDKEQILKQTKKWRRARRRSARTERRASVQRTPSVLFRSIAEPRAPNMEGVPLTQEGRTPNPEIP